MTFASLLHGISHIVACQYSSSSSYSNWEKRQNVDLVDGKDLKKLFKKTSQLGIVTTTNVCLLNNLSEGHQVMSTIALIRESIVSFHIIGNTPRGMDVYNIMFSGICSIAISTNHNILTTG